jgi:diguanylate cyclase (GGDEF)-like protein
MTEGPHRTPADAGAAGPQAAARPQLRLLLHTPDADLRRAWGALAVDGFRLQTLERLSAASWPADEPSLVLLDAATAAAAPDDLAEAIDANLHRCVWTGPAEAIDRLGEARLAGAYDLVVTPATAATLACRLQGWARRIEQTAALDRLGRRVDELAAENRSLAARLADTQEGAGDLAVQRERLARAMRRIHEVARLSRRINSLDLDEIVDVCIHDLPDLVEARRASLYFYDPGGDRLVLQGHSHESPIAERVELGANPHSPMALAVRRAQVLLIGQFNQFQQEQDVILERPFEDQYQTTSCIIVPLKGSDRVLGVLNLADKVDGSRFDQEIDLPVIEQIAELVGTSIYNVELFREMEHRAKSDPLTGLANRRALEEALARETDRARRYGTPLSALMIDVDGLKDVNDRFGHPAGDAVLQNIAAILLETVRSVDVPGRWAGDEFLVILSDTAARPAEQLARRLRARANEQAARLDDATFPASLSIGVTQYVKDETPETLVRRVDQALYAAKAGGRDRIAVV